MNKCKSKDIKSIKVIIVRVCLVISKDLGVPLIGWQNIELGHLDYKSKEYL